MQFNENVKIIQVEIWKKVKHRSRHVLVLEECKAKNIIGKYVTPYVLDKINELSKGESLKANQKLTLCI